MQTDRSGCSTPFTCPPSDNPAISFVANDDTINATRENVEQVPKETMVEPASDTTLCSQPVLQNNSKRVAAMQVPAGKFDWKMFWAGLIYSLLLPFLMPLAGWYISTFEKRWTQWLGFFAFLITLIAFTTAIIFIFKGNALWLPLYLASFVISMAYTIKMSFLKENGRSF